MDFKRISDVVDNYRDEIVDFVVQLVKIPTENLPPAGREYEGQEFFKKACRRINLEIDEFRPSDIEGFEENSAFLKDRIYNDRMNIVGKWKGDGDGKSLILSGHMDIAPKEPLPWKICDPFEGKILNGKIYGRGTADMKGGLACGYMALKILKDQGWQPKGDIIIESVVDEEYASGNGTIASRFRGHNADFAVNLEASGLIVCPACVGGIVYKININGTSGMPYAGEEIYNPVYGISRIVEIIQGYEEYRNKNVKMPELWKDSIQESKLIITKISGGETKEHGQLGAPMNSWLEVVIQTYPGETEEAIYESFSGYINTHAEKYKELKDIKIDIERQYQYIEPGECDVTHEGVSSLVNCAKSVMGPSVKVAGAPFSCDLFAFKKYGDTPAVIFGPLGGNLHAPDEWVDIESLVTLTKTLVLMIMEWCS